MHAPRPRARDVLVRRSTLEDVFLRLTGRTPGRLMATRRRGSGADRALDDASTGARGAARCSSSFLSPVLFLPAMGIGLGALVDDDTSLDGARRRRTSSFLAPGLLATHARCMVAARRGDVAGDRRASSGTARTPRWSTTPLDPARRRARATSPGWRSGAVASPRSFVRRDARCSAPSSRRGAARHPGRGAHRAGVRRTDRGVSATPARTTAAFAALNRFVIMPMYLFSGTFFPISQLPARSGRSRTSRRCGTASTCAATWRSATPRVVGASAHVGVPGRVRRRPARWSRRCTYRTVLAP